MVIVRVAVGITAGRDPVHWLRLNWRYHNAHTLVLLGETAALAEPARRGCEPAAPTAPGTRVDDRHGEREHAPSEGVLARKRHVEMKRTQTRAPAREAKRVGEAVEEPVVGRTIDFKVQRGSMALRHDRLRLGRAPRGSYRRRGGRLRPAVHVSEAEIVGPTPILVGQHVIGLVDDLEVARGGRAHAVRMVPSRERPIGRSNSRGTLGARDAEDDVVVLLRHVFALRAELGGPFAAMRPGTARALFTSQRRAHPRGPTKFVGGPRGGPLLSRPRSRLRPRARASRA
jgi:hypothetical protein